MVQGGAQRIRRGRLLRGHRYPERSIEGRAGGVRQLRQAVDLPLQRHHVLSRSKPVELGIRDSVRGRKRPQPIVEGRKLRLQLGAIHAHFGSGPASLGGLPQLYLALGGAMHAPQQCRGPSRIHR